MNVGLIYSVTNSKQQTTAIYRALIPARLPAIVDRPPSKTGVEAHTQ